MKKIAEKKVVRSRMPLTKRVVIAKRMYRTFVPMEKIICCLLVLMITSSNVALMARLSGLDKVADKAANIYLFSGTMILSLIVLYFALYTKNKEQAK